MPDSKVVGVIRAHRAAMNAKEAETTLAMAQAWLGVERSLDANIAALANEMLRRTQAGETITPSMVRAAERYKTLKAQTGREIEKYNEQATGLIADGQLTALSEGLVTAQDAITASTEFDKQFNHINIGAVDSMVGYAGDGSPLSELLNNSVGAEAAESMLDALISGVAGGKGAAEVAREMAADLGGNFDRSLVIARTEINRSYRAASTEQYRESGVVIKFKRLVARDEACASCIALDGEEFSTAEEFDDHVRGRCSVIPVLEGVEPPQWEQAQDWFAEQPESKQREVLGAGRFELYKSGVPLADMVTKVHSDTWGDSPALIPLKDLQK